MFTNNFKLDQIDKILTEIGYLSEEAKDENAAGEDQEHKYPKKSGKKSKDYDGDGTVEDETDEYAGVKDRAIKKAIRKNSKDDVEESCGSSYEKKTKKKMIEDVDFSSILDELTDEDLLFLSDELIEEVVEEVFYETLEEGFEIDELETLLIEQVESELTYLEEANVTLGHDTKQDAGSAARERLLLKKPEESSRTSKLARVKDAVHKVASGAKAIAKKVAGATGEVAGSLVTGYRKASAAADRSSSNTGSKYRQRSSSVSGTNVSGTNVSGTNVSGTKRPGILGRVGTALKSGLKKAIYGAGKAVGKVVKTAKAGYDDGRDKSAPVSAPAAKPAPKTATAKKKSDNLTNLLNQIRQEAVYGGKKEEPKDPRMVVTAADRKANTKAWQNYKAGNKAYRTADHLDEAKKDPCWKGYEMIGMKKKGGREVPNCVPKDKTADHLDEAKQGPCWKGYEMIGMKKKGGREVPNCVPKEEYVDIERDMLEEGYTFEQVLEVIAAYEDGFEVIFEEEGVTINEIQEVLDEEAQFLSDVEIVADWLYAEGVIESEDQFFELMEDLSQEEIEELYDVVLSELYKGRHGQSETEYQDSRSDAGKIVSGTSKLSGAAYTYRGVKNTGPNPAGGSQRPHGQGRMTTGQRTELQYRKANLKKKLQNNGYEMIGTSLEEGGLEVRNYSWKEVMEQQSRGDKRREEFEKWYRANAR
jgi:hypothetical protein